MADKPTTSPKRPYLLRAYFDWLLDNDLTPYLAVNAEYFGVRVPQEYVKDGQIVLNLSPNATGGLQIANEFVEFDARFRGVPQHIFIPMGAVMAIYARENGDGVMFEYEAVYDEELMEQPTGFHEAVDNPPAQAEKSQTEKAKGDKPKGASHLRIIK